jgi:chromosome segregation ATPase
MHGPHWILPRRIIGKTYASFLKRLSDIGGLPKVFSGISTKTHPIVRLAGIVSLPDWNEVKRETDRLSPEDLLALPSAIADLREAITEAQNALKVAQALLAQKQAALRVSDEAIKRAGDAITALNDRIGQIGGDLPGLINGRAGLPGRMHDLENKISALADRVLDHLHIPTRRILGVEVPIGPPDQVFRPKPKKASKRDELNRVRVELDEFSRRIDNLQTEKRRLEADLPVQVAAKATQVTAHASLELALVPAHVEVDAAQKALSELQTELQELEAIEERARQAVGS